MSVVGAKFGPGKAVEGMVASCTDGEETTTCSHNGGSPNWLSLKLAPENLNSRLFVVLQPSLDPSERSALDGIEVWRGATFGDHRSQLAERCSGAKPCHVPPAGGPFTIACVGSSRGTFLTIRQVGTRRVLALADVAIYAARLPSPPTPPPHRPPHPMAPTPPRPPPRPPLPPPPPFPPHQPPLVVLGEWKPGFAGRYMDCCKPYCSVPTNERFGAPLTPFCNAFSAPSGFRFGQNGCEGTTPDAGYACYSQTPWQDSVDPSLSYGFVATSPAIARCGQCFEFDFRGSRGHYAPNDAGSFRLRGKRSMRTSSNPLRRMRSNPEMKASHADMCNATVVVAAVIVQATNFGPDYSSNGHFSLMIPGGGVELGDACYVIWAAIVRGLDLGVRYGGFLARCQGCEEPGIGCKPQPRPHERTRECVRAMCDAVFDEVEYEQLGVLRRACEWFVDWYAIADNPTMRYRPVECPRAILGRLIQ